MADSVRRRRRPAVSCSLCRRRKIRCNRESPCSNCVRTGSTSCVYDAFPPAATASNGSQPASEAKLLPAIAAACPEPASHGRDDAIKPPVGSTPALPHRTSATSRGTDSTPSKPAGSGVTQSPASSAPPSRVDSASLWDTYSPGQLKHNQKHYHDVVDEISSQIAGNFHMLSDRDDDKDPSHPSISITRSFTHKSRTFGQSHWIGASLLFRDLIELLDPHISASQNNVATDGLRRCKTLARIIKARRSPEWPTVPTPQLPAREVADKLVQCYLQTSETIYRVLHIPSFLRDYEPLWASRASNSGAAPDETTTEKETAFLVQVKLVLAIGAVTYDDEFSLRSSAIRWVYEAQTWFAEPRFKSRMLSLQSLQTNLLLLIANELVDISGDSVWIGAGSLLRRAIHMGLHRDPAHLPKNNLLVTEMRRRLWNTILEINLQSCMSAGTPPNLSLDDFDTLPPGNFDDDQLVDVPPAAAPGSDASVSSDNHPASKPEDCYTQTAVALALRRALPVRLKTARALNNVRSSYGTYEQTLKLDGELRTAYREVCQTLQGYKAKASPDGGKGPTTFELRAVDLILQRYLCFLHIPYIQASLHEKAYAYSRKAALESALKVWYLVYPPPQRGSSFGFLSGSSGSARGVNTSFDDEQGKGDVLTRFTICGYGFFRTTVAKVPMIVAKEVRMQRLEEQGLGSVMPMRPDLVAVLEAARVWHRRTLLAGETNMKGYLLAHGVVSYIEAMARGVDDMDEKLVLVLVQAVGESVDLSIPILEQHAARYGDPDVAGTLAGAAVDVGLDEVGGVSAEGDQAWDSLMSDVLLFDGSPGDDPMSWMLSDNTMGQEWMW